MKSSFVLLALLGSLSLCQADAMARVHLLRALEMLPTITQRNNMRDHTRLKLAVSLLQLQPTAP